MFWSTAAMVPISSSRRPQPPAVKHEQKKKEGKKSSQSIRLELSAKGNLSCAVQTTVWASGFEAAVCWCATTPVQICVEVRHASAVCLYPCSCHICHSLLVEPAMLQLCTAKLKLFVCMYGRVCSCGCPLQRTWYTS